MAINLHIDKFVFCCPDCRLVAEELRYCPVCKKKLHVVREGYIAGIFGDTIIKTNFPGQKKPPGLKDFPWLSISQCPKCKKRTHFEKICSKDQTTLKKTIIKLAYACKKDRILFSKNLICPVCKIPAIRVEEVHACKHAT